MLFAATGPVFREMAVEAAKSVRAHCPGLPIDLVTDAPPPEEVFDEVRLLQGYERFPKIPALRGTRFERTLYLDSDVRVVADLTDIFELLDRFDLAAAHDPMRNSSKAVVSWRQPLPNAFPQFNAGVLAYRRSPAVMRLLDEWDAGVRELATGKDQPVLRELLWTRDDLRVAVLPPEYNLWDLAQLSALHPLHAAPRLLHSYRFVGEPALEQVLGRWGMEKLAMLIRADRSLAARAGREPVLPGRAELWRLQAARLGRLGRRLTHRLMGVRTTKHASHLKGARRHS